MPGSRSATANGPARPPASRPATCRAISRSCQRAGPRLHAVLSAQPKPCPLLAAGSPGDWRLPSLADDLDIRTDLCRYKVFRNGELVDEPTDLKKHWRDDW